MKVIFGILTIFSLSSCNMLAFMDSPSGDVQLLDYARACLDKGDYDCALRSYKELSNSYLDVKISETTLTTLAANKVFFFSDLINALGSGKGGASTFLSLAEAIASRSKTTGADRVIIQKEYTNSAAIADTTLKAYMQFITSTAAVSQILASAVGADGKLTASDLANSPDTCKGLTSITCIGNAACDGGGLTDADASEVSGPLMDTAANWDTSASIAKLRLAISAADTASGILFSSGASGMSAAIAALNGTFGVTDAEKAECTRMILLQTFFP